MIQETSIFDAIGCGDGGDEGEVEDVLEGRAIKEISGLEAGVSFGEPALLLKGLNIILGLAVLFFLPNTRQGDVVVVLAFEDQTNLASPGFCRSSVEY